MFNLGDGIFRQRMGWAYVRYKAYALYPKLFFMQTNHISKMKVLFETDQLIIEHEFESAFLIDKSSGKKVVSDDFYGDPECGLISSNNDWAIIAGEHLTAWRKSVPEEDQLVRIENEDLQLIKEMRLKTQDTIEILIDPWSEKSVIWEMNINDLSYKKIKDFPNSQETKYTDKIDW
ncbi:hypothetical protein DMA11_04030 [Marinilabiliaceae bacterium JC017]|nr:hypothetical protein DMA11_04030 [Marinilabiliaceae bacterium JC017]